ncbi:hypothetical protein L1987_63348 [Smallanthus sonchifolius]|uniref:Uncharacterized protein n=1 Tax=Smallanthus sonchifolius TaxID=185202 RepID=A0ACB9CCZ3_9ASTR|nr:hypothetical protein L1987_63348 [Smallanthus sonchifolius]
MSHFSPLLLLPFFFFITPSAESYDSTQPNCPLHKCGDVDINYPFWKIDSESTNQFCGYPGFGINCTTIDERSIPQITFTGDSFHVLRTIKYSSIVLADRDVFSVGPDPNNCPRVRHGINLQTLPLSFSEVNVNLSFHFSCTGFPSFASEIPCMEKNQKKSFVYIMNTSRPVEPDWDVYSCSQEVVTTVLRENINRFPVLSTEFGRLLEGGFELKWRRTDDCGRCEDSYGQCGHRNPTGFICFCRDGTTSMGDCLGTIITTLKFQFHTHVLDPTLNCICLWLIWH